MHNRKGFKLAVNKNEKNQTHNFRNIKTLIILVFAKFMRFSMNKKSPNIKVFSSEGRIRTNDLAYARVTTAF